MMNKRTVIQTVKDLERIYLSAEPQEGFLAGLEKRLVEMHKDEMENSVIGVRKNPIMSWAMARAAVVVLVVGVILWIGPSQVLAQVQEILGYVPGYGFVDVEDVRMIAAPISQTQGGVTVTIKQVVAKEFETFVVMKVEGLPSYKDDDFWFIPRLSDESVESWHERIELLWTGTGTRLVLEGGREIKQKQPFQGAPWEGYFTFNALPKNALKVVLEVPRLPAVPEGGTPEDWRFEIELGYVANPDDPPQGEDYDNVGCPDDCIPLNIPLLYPTPIETFSAPDRVYGFGFELIDVVYAETEVALRVKVVGFPEGWTIYGPTLDGRLEDDLGNVYEAIYGPNTNAWPPPWAPWTLQEERIYTLTFDPVSPDAKTLTLSITNLLVDFRVAGEYIEFDFGDSPQVGDVFPMDSTVDVLGIPIHFSSVRIHDEEVSHTPEQTPFNTFEFEIDRYEIANGILVGGMELPNYVISLFVGGGSPGGVSGGGGEDVENPGFGKLRLSIGIPATEPLPTGSFQLPIIGVSVYFMNEYTITWAVDADR